MTIEEYIEFISELKEDDFFPYSQQVDADVCSENPCSNDGCGAKSTRYEGWRKNTGRINFGKAEFEYQAVSICDQCGDVVLF